MYNYESLPQEGFKNQQIGAGKNINPQANNPPQNFVYSGQLNFQNNSPLNMNLNPQQNIQNNMGNMNGNLLPYDYISSTKSLLLVNLITNCVYIFTNMFFIFRYDLPFYDYGNVFLYSIMLIEMGYYITINRKINKQQFTIQDARSLKDLTGYILILYILSFMAIGIFMFRIGNTSTYNQPMMVFLYIIFVVAYSIPRLVSICKGQRQYIPRNVAVVI